MAPPGRRCEDGGLEGMIPARSTVLVVRRQPNQIARRAGLLQGNTLLPGQRRCRSPALRAIWQGRWGPQLRGNVRRGCLVYRRDDGANWAP